MRPAILAAFLVIWLLPGPAVAQTTPDAAQAGGSSLSHSALKAITYKIATTTVNLTIFSVAAGGMVAGSALTAFGAAASVTVYTVNDYLWSSNLPPPARQENDAGFDMAGAFWRTTEKFLTYKAATLWIKAIKAGSLYAYTGSSTTTLVAISAATAINAGVFYANNMAWDYYDSLSLPPPAAAPAPPPVAAPLIARVPERAPKS